MDSSSVCDGDDGDNSAVKDVKLGPLEIQRIAQILASDPLLPKNWKQFCGKLDISPIVQHDLERNVSETVLSKFFEIIQSWVSKNGSSAGLNALISHLKDLDYIQCAESLQNMDVDQASEPYVPLLPEPMSFRPPPVQQAQPRPAQQPQQLPTRVFRPIVSQSSFGSRIQMLCCCRTWKARILIIAASLGTIGFISYSLASKNSSSNTTPGRVEEFRQDCFIQNVNHAVCFHNNTRKSEMVQQIDSNGLPIASYKNLVNLTMEVSYLSCHIIATLLNLNNVKNNIEYLGLITYHKCNKNIANCVGQTQIAFPRLEYVEIQISRSDANLDCLPLFITALKAPHLRYVSIITGQVPIDEESARAAATFIKLNCHVGLRVFASSNVFCTPNGYAHTCDPNYLNTVCDKLDKRQYK